MIGFAAEIEGGADVVAVLPHVAGAALLLVTYDGRGFVVSEDDLYKDGGVSDAKVFALKEGLTWTDASSRVFTADKAELKDWIGHRAEAGRLPPRGFPRNNRFG